MKSKLILRDRGFEKAAMGIAMLGDGFVTVGVHPGAMHNDPRTGETKTLVEVAVANEYGTSKIPARSFLRATMDGRREEIAQVQTKVAKAVANGKITPKQGLGILGSWIEGAIKARIASNVPPPNAPSTIARKGSTRTLIDTSQLLQGITHKIHLGRERPAEQPASDRKGSPAAARGAQRGAARLAASSGTRERRSAARGRRTTA